MPRQPASQPASQLPLLCSAEKKNMQYNQHLRIQPKYLSLSSSEDNYTLLECFRLQIFFIFGRCTASCTYVVNEQRALKQPIDYAQVLEMRWFPSTYCLLFFSHSHSSTVLRVFREQKTCQGKEKAKYPHVPKFLEHFWSKQTPPIFYVVLNWLV